MALCGAYTVHLEGAATRAFITPIDSVRSPSDHRGGGPGMRKHWSVSAMRNEFPNVPKPDISAARTICLPSWRIVELIARRFRWNVVLRGGQLFTESFEGNWLHRRGARGGRTSSSTASFGARPADAARIAKTHSRA